MAIQRQSTTSPLIVSAQGRTVHASWTLTARSRVAAELAMRSIGVALLKPYREIDDSIPDPFLVCSEIVIDRYEESPEGLADSVYQVDAKYTPINGSSTKPGLELKVDGPAIWTVEPSSNSAPVDIDRNGYAITNAAGVPIEGASQPVTSEILVAEWIRSNVNFFAATAKSRTFTSHTNSTQWKGADAREVFCHGLQPQALDNFAFSGGGLVKYTARFEFKNSREIKAELLIPTGQPDRPFKAANTKKVPGFSSVFLNQGVVELNPDYDKDSLNSSKSSRYRAITMIDSEGRKAPISNPVLLNGSGVYETDDSRRKAYAILVESIEESDFNTLGI